jgi:hypothetical protein
LADSKTKAAEASGAAVSKGERTKFISLIELNNGSNWNHRRPVESQHQQEIQFSGAVDNNMHQKIASQDRHGKTG